MKSHYKIYQQKKLVYFFTTTTINLEDCLNIIAERFNNLPYYKVFLNGELVEEKPRQRIRAKQVLDKLTGKIYKSALDFSIKTGEKYSTARYWLSLNNHKRVVYDRTK